MSGCKAICPKGDGMPVKAEYLIGTHCFLDAGHADHHRVYYMGDNKRLTSWTWWDELNTPVRGSRAGADTMNAEEWAAIKAALSPEQVERIKAKCAWEQMPWLGVYRDWPSLFVSETMSVRPDETLALRDEMTCDRCGREHGVVWFAPSDVWNAVMREGDRGKPDEFSFCCPICFMQLANERGIENTGWLVAPDQGQIPAPFDSLADALVALRSRGSTEPEEVAARERIAFNGCDAHGKPWPCDECGENRSRGSSDTTESKVLDAFSEMWPDFDFGGCYDLDDLLNHATGQLGNERSERGSTDTRLTEALREARTFVEMVLECDKYGCENGPYDCLHGQASRQLTEIDAALAAARADAEQEQA